MRIKREALVLGVKKSLTARPNGRSADFIAPSTANGCAMACAYCYVPRRKGYSNPITRFANIDQIAGYLDRHVARQGTKPEPNQCDPQAWVYDIGENSDCSVDALISDNVRDLVDAVPRAAHRQGLLRHQVRQPRPARAGPAGPDPGPLLPDARRRWPGSSTSAPRPMPSGSPRSTTSSPPATRSTSTSPRSSSPTAGWRSGPSCSPQLDDGLGPRAKAQLAAEVIFLTHNEALHEVNLAGTRRRRRCSGAPTCRRPSARENGALNVRYRSGAKRGYLDQLQEALARTLPECTVRYAF